MADTTYVEQLDDVLRQRFGLSAFHPWQREAIEALLAGERRVLVVAPTGGGKSLCYQVPAVVLEGTTIVVSPLIALMDDQVRALEARGVSATYIASSLDAEERRRREQRLREGNVKLLYVAPERLALGGIVESLAKLRPALVAIDEAHCISQWGHDFRPDYLRLGEVLTKLAPAHVLACTATATPLVRTEILAKLGLPERDTKVVLRGFARPNLHLAAREITTAREREKELLRAIEEAGEGAVIVYAMTRRSAEELAPRLGVLTRKRAAAYHAGLASEERGRVSQAFAERTLDLVVATNAFGMGIDRADVRLVAHASPPGSIEAYYQEVGRAGRDGAAAYGLLLTAPGDLATRRRLIESDRRDGGSPKPEEVARQWGMFKDLLRYVEAGSCRHDFILRYFGDEQETLGGCGHCDVCERLDDAPARTEPTGDEALVVRKALAGVARARGHAGMNAVADMLVGKDDERVRTLGLAALSTFGILRAHKQPWVLALLRRLVTAGLVDIEHVGNAELPVPVITPLGVTAMKGETPVRVLLPDEGAGERRKKPRRDRERDRTVELALSPADADVFERLRAARLELAKAQGVPPYVVAHDRTLIELAAKKPRTRADLTGVHGMGPARIDAYGDRLIAAIGG